MDAAEQDLVGAEGPERATPGSQTTQTAASAPQKLAQAIGNRALARLLQAGPTGPGPAIALRAALGAAPPRRSLARHLKQDQKVTEGVFKLHLIKQRNPGSKSGLRGFIRFRPNHTAPDSTRIRLYQAVRIINLETGMPVIWKPELGGRDDPRTTMQTLENAKRGIQAGWVIDHDPALVKPKSTASDPEIVPYYNRYWQDEWAADGYKDGHRVREASLWDYPGSEGDTEFAFETVAKAFDSGHVYGSVTWGFTVSDGANGVVEREHAAGRDTPLPSTEQALRSFNEYYRNPGASTAPAE